LSYGRGEYKVYLGCLCLQPKTTLGIVAPLVCLIIKKTIEAQVSYGRIGEWSLSWGYEIYNPKTGINHSPHNTCFHLYFFILKIIL